MRVGAGNGNPRSCGLNETARRAVGHAMKRIGVVFVVAVVLAGCLGRVSAPNAAATATPAAGSTSPSPVVRTPKATPKPTSRPTRAPASGAAGPAYAQLIGQKLVVRMDGTTPSAALLGRIGRGEVGGVVLFGSNITTRAALGRSPGSSRPRRRRAASRRC